jgi:hypothetical protein
MSDKRMDEVEMWERIALKTAKEGRPVAALMARNQAYLVGKGDELQVMLEREARHVA